METRCYTYDLRDFAQLQIFLWGMETSSPDGQQTAPPRVTNLPMRNGNYSPGNTSSSINELQIFLWGMETFYPLKCLTKADWLQIFLWGMETRLLRNLPHPRRRLQIFLWGMETEHYTPPWIPAPAKLQIFLWGMETRNIMTLNILKLKSYKSSYEEWKLGFTSLAITAKERLQIFLWGMETIKRMKEIAAERRYKSSYEEWKRGFLWRFATDSEVTNLPMRNGNRVSALKTWSSTCVTNLPMRNGNFHQRTGSILKTSLQIFLWGMETGMGHAHCWACHSYKSSYEEWKHVFREWFEQSHVCYKSSYEEWKHEANPCPQLGRLEVTNLPMRNGNRREPSHLMLSGVRYKSSYEEWKQGKFFRRDWCLLRYKSSYEEWKRQI